MTDRQPWVLNLVIPKHEEVCQNLKKNFSALGVGNKAVKVKGVDRPKIAAHEVTKDAIMDMDIKELVANMQAYE